MAPAPEPEVSIGREALLSKLGLLIQGAKQKLASVVADDEASAAESSEEEPSEADDEPSEDAVVAAAEAPAVETPPAAETPGSETPVGAPGTPAPETPVAEVESLESKVAEAEESSIVEASALASAGALAEAEVLEADKELDQETEQKLMELFSANKQFDTWVRSVSTEQKQKIIEFHYKGHENFQDFQRYLRHVKDMEIFEGCSKCRYDLTGCLKCTLSKAQNYVLRNGKLPAWWKAKDHVLRCAGYIYIYIYIYILFHPPSPPLFPSPEKINNFGADPIRGVPGALGALGLNVGGPS